MQLTLIRFFVRSLHFEEISTETSDENQFDIDYTVSFYEQRTNDFFVEFAIEVKSGVEFTLSATILFHFSTNEKITEEFAKSHFPVINAPAIAFPYIRTLVSNFTLNAGYMPAVLPSVNFVNLVSDKSKVFFNGQAVETFSLKQPE